MNLSFSRSLFALTLATTMVGCGAQINSDPHRVDEFNCQEETDACEKELSTLSWSNITPFDMTGAMVWLTRDIFNNVKIQDQPFNIQSLRVDPNATLELVRALPSAVPTIVGYGDLETCTGDFKGLTESLGPLLYPVRLSVADLLRALPREGELATFYPVLASTFENAKDADDLSTRLKNLGNAAGIVAPEKVEQVCSTMSMILGPSSQASDGLAALIPDLPGEWDEVLRQVVSLAESILGPLLQIGLDALIDEVILREGMLPTMHCQFDDASSVAHCNLKRNEGRDLLVDFQKNGSSVSTTRLEITFENLGPDCLSKAVWDREAQTLVTDKDDECLASSENP